MSLKGNYTKDYIDNYDTYNYKKYISESNTYKNNRNFVFLVRTKSFQSKLPGRTVLLLTEYKIS